MHTADTPARRGLAIGAAGVTIALTAAAFWLSYAHLHTIAADNGLASDAARAWAWPATVDLFIVAGELLMLRAALARRVDWWAIALTAVGSLGSIVLNIAGVGRGAAILEYVVAAVPPVAALLAFGAVMRQVHELLAAPSEPAVEQPVPEAVPAHPSTPPAVPDKAHLPSPVATETAGTEPSAAVDLLTEPVPDPEPEPDHEFALEIEDHSAPPPAEDDLTPVARAEYANLLAAHDMPSIRTLRSAYAIGQTRAQRIRAELGAVLAGTSRA